MSTSDQPLNILAKILGGLVLLAFPSLLVVSVMMTEPDDAEAVCGVVAVLILLAANGWVLFARYHYEMEPLKILAQVVGVLVPLTVYGMFVLDWDDFESVFTMVGVILLLEIVVGGVAAYLAPGS